MQKNGLQILVIDDSDYKSEPASILVGDAALNNNKGEKLKIEASKNFPAHCSHS
jgi:hypothetical protein